MQCAVGINGLARQQRAATHSPMLVPPGRLSVVACTEPSTCTSRVCSKAGSQAAAGKQTRQGWRQRARAAAAAQGRAAEGPAAPQLGRADDAGSLACLGCAAKKSIWVRGEHGDGVICRQALHLQRGRDVFVCGAGRDSDAQRGGDVGALRAASHPTHGQHLDIVCEQAGEGAATMQQVNKADCRHLASMDTTAQACKLAHQAAHPPIVTLKADAVSARMRLVRMASGAAFTPACTARGSSIRPETCKKRQNAKRYYKAGV